MEQEKNKLFAALQTAEKNGESKEQDSLSQKSVAGEIDPKGVSVDVTSPAPIVVFYGPPSIGKTVALIRLSRHLIERGCQVIPDKEFRKKDENYQDLCLTFNDRFIKSAFKPESTAVINFLLLKVQEDSKDVCQLLEAPGEHFFNRSDPAADYMPYFHAIINNVNPKVYVFFLEINWEDPDIRKAYEQKILDFTGHIGKKDSTIFLVNKADEFMGLMHNQKPENGEFIKFIKQQYPLIFRRFLEVKLFKPSKYRSDYVVFSSGNFNGVSGAFTNSISHFPDSLWQKIRSGLVGGWKLF